MKNIQHLYQYTQMGCEKHIDWKKFGLKYFRAQDV